jgi:hypothetical protein
LILSLSGKGKIAFRTHEALHARIDRALHPSIGSVSEAELAHFERFLSLVEEYNTRIAE